MNELEERLRRDQAAGIPDPPDVRYTIAAVRRRLGDKPVLLQCGRSDRLSGHRARPDRSEDWLLLLAAFATLVASIGATFIHGLSPWWLIVIPIAAITLCPILLRKGV